MIRGLGHMLSTAMNCLQLIKKRSLKRKAIERACLRITKQFASNVYIDELHTPVYHEPPYELRYRGLVYDPNSNTQMSKNSKILRYRGVTYGVY